MAKWKGNHREIGEDFFETPRTSIEPVLPFIPDGVRVIWECTYGKGAIGNLLEEKGYTVIKTDLYPKTENTVELDFLTGEPDAPYDFIMFNPPFSLKTEFLKRAIELGKPFLFICPITIAETNKRFKMFRDNHLSIINLPNRTNYLSKGEKGDVRKVFFHSVWVLKCEQHQDRILYVE